MKANISGQAFSRESGEPVGSPRTEEVDSTDNILFRGCKNVLDFKRAYEAFWNDFNPKSREVVFVQNVQLFSH